MEELENMFKIKWAKLIENDEIVLPPTEKDLQYMLDNAFVINYDDLPYINYAWSELHLDDIENLECKLLLDVFNGHKSEQLDEWMHNSDTDLKILYFLCRNDYIYHHEMWYSDVYQDHPNDLDLNLFFQKCSTGITPVVFNVIVTFFDDKFNDEKIIDGLINWYKPISDSGALHFFFIEKRLFEQYLSLSDQYSFDIYNNMHENYVYTGGDDEYFDLALQAIKENKTIKLSTWEVILIVLKNNFDKLDLDEKEIYIHSVKQFLNENTNSHTRSVYIVMNHEDIFDKIKNDIHIYFETRMNDSFFIYKIKLSINAGVFQRILKIIIDISPDKQLLIERQLIMYGSKKQLDEYFDNYSQKTIDNFIRQNI